MVNDLQFLLKEYGNTPGFRYDKSANCIAMVFQYGNALFMAMFAFDANGYGKDCAFTVDDIYAKYGSGRWRSADQMALAMVASNSFQTKRYGDDLSITFDPRKAATGINNFHGSLTALTVNRFIALMNLAFEKKVPLIKDTPSAPSYSAPRQAPSINNNAKKAAYQKGKKLGLIFMIVGIVLVVAGIALASMGGGGAMISIGSFLIVAGTPLFIVGLVKLIRNGSKLKKL
ncbi:MAG: hypothetical protein J6038_05120 [Bacilli bacterium]|nr:hypothetical protein [Bacilli bacterium]